jgi:hypothetical protein
MITKTEDGAKKESEELCKYATEIMGLVPPIALIALIRAASDLIIKDFPQNSWELIWLAAIATAQADMKVARARKEKS